jgi:hypothetical protein
MSNQTGGALEPSRPKDESLRIVWVLLVLVVLALGLIGYGLYLLFATAPVEISAAVIAVTGTILVSVLGYFLSRQLETRSARQQKELEQRATSYQDFMRFCLLVLTEDNENEALRQSERTQKFHDCSQDLIVWGSDVFLERYLDFKTHIDIERYKAFDHEKTEREFAAALVKFEKLLHTMRTDLNSDSKQLPQGTLLRMFLKKDEVEAIMQVTSGRPQLPPPKEGKSHVPA